MDELCLGASTSIAQHDTGHCFIASDEGFWLKIGRINLWAATALMAVARHLKCQGTQ